MLFKVTIQFVLFTSYVAAAVFWPARTFAYPGGWVTRVRYRLVPGVW